jgi:hypothetical protein
LLLFLEGLEVSHFLWRRCGRVPSCSATQGKKKKESVFSLSLSLIHASGLVKKNIYYPMYFNRNLIPRTHTHTLFYYFSQILFFLPSFLLLFLPSTRHTPNVVECFTHTHTHTQERRKDGWTWTSSPGPGRWPFKKKRKKRGAQAKRREYERD